MRFAAWSILGLLCLATVGCRDEGPPGCRIAQSTPLARNGLTLARDVRLHRIGEGFALVAVEGDQVRWASLAADGALGAVHTVAVPAQRSLDRAVWVALTGQDDAPGSQLMVFFVAPGAAANQLELFAIAQPAGGEASPARSLAQFPAGADPAAIRVAAGSSRSGRRAVVTWGIEGPEGSPSFLALDGGPWPDPPPAPRRLYQRDEIARWRCLAVVPSHSDFAVSVVEPEQPTGTTGWRIFELRDDGGRGYEVGIGFDVGNAGCPAVAPTPLGYAVAYQNNEGTHFSEYDLAHNFVNSRILAGALRFGGVQRQPPVACIAPMGREFAVMFERSTGPEVRRYDAFGRPQGSALALPAAAGEVGPLASWPLPGQLYTTYLDVARRGAGGQSSGNSSQNERYLVRVECPLALPPFPTDAGADDAGK